MRLFRRRRRPRRTVSRTERVIGGLLLLLLPAIAGAVYVAGQRFDPGLFAFDPAGGQEAGRGRWVLPLPSPVEGWALAGEVERFRADSLYVKIDGRAEQYLAYDVVGLEAMTLVDARRPGRLVEVFVYDMGGPASAFGVFSVERSPGTSVALGRDGYRSRSSVFFYKGRYYAQILPSEEGGEMERVATAVAEAVARRMGDREGPLWGLTAFPATGLTPNSAQYLKRDALSLDFLTDVYTARYGEGEGEVTAFLSQRRSPQEAREVYERYVAYLQKYGKVVAQGEAVAEGEIGGFYEAVFRKGEVFGGVTGARGREAARARAKMLMDGL